MDIFDIQGLIEAVGTIGLIVIIFAESGLLLGIIFPGDSLLFTAGLFASTNKFGLNIFAVAGGAFVAAVLGAQVGYWIGHRYGPRLFQRPDSRIFKAEYVERSRVFFDKHGSKAIVLARFVPFVRTLAPPMAGMGEMEIRTFTIFNIIGAALWALGVTLLGYFAGDLIPKDKVDTYLLPIIGVIILISLIPPFLEYRKHRQTQGRPDEPVGD
ncbi:MAG: DedA family protein [Acidimicrobiia bacterium]